MFGVWAKADLSSSVIIDTLLFCVQKSISWCTHSCWRIIFLYSSIAREKIMQVQLHAKIRIWETHMVTKPCSNLMPYKGYEPGQASVVTITSNPPIWYNGYNATEYHATIESHATSPSLIGGLLNPSSEHTIWYRLHFKVERSSPGPAVDESLLMLQFPRPHLPLYCKKW